MSWIRLRAFGAAIAALHAVACGSHDPASRDAATELDGEARDCVGASDGTPCGAGSICIDGACAESRCGDGVVDATTAEQCDDANDIAFDGCEPDTCQLTCESDADCDDGQPCNGAEHCSETAHLCEAGEALPMSSPCPRPDAPDGVCRGSGRSAQCSDLGCGNGVVDGEEQCDDANTENGDGCNNDCSFSCLLDEDCAAIDTNVCDGADTCDTATHTCVPGRALDCDDGIACTDDTCDPRKGCVHTDNGTGNFWYADCDEDDYAFSETGAERHCLRPDTSPSVCADDGGWTSRRPVGADIDCLDSNADVHPASNAFRTSAIREATANADFDYNCDGEEELERGVASATICRCTGDWYYDNEPRPECGRRQEYKWACRESAEECVGYWSRTLATEIVACR